MSLEFIGQCTFNGAKACSQTGRCEGIDFLHDQGAHGGEQRNGGSGGPMMPEVTWDGIVERVLDMYEPGCAYPGGLRMAADRETARKHADDELTDKPTQDISDLLIN